MKFHHIALTIKNFEVSAKFYGEFFGLKEIKSFRRDDFGATGHFLKGEDDFILELWQFDNFNEGMKNELSVSGLKHVAFLSENIDIDYHRFKNTGLDCTLLKIGATGGKYFFLSDPDGNQIEIYNPPNNI